MSPEFDAKFRTTALTGLRIAAGAGYFTHGAAKLFGWFGGMGGPGKSVELMSRFGAAGVIEVICGACIILGLFTRPLAFIASGEMAVTYFWMHWAFSGKMWWWENRGEIVMVYAFVWLLYAAYGAGPVSLDAWLKGQRQDA